MQKNESKETLAASGSQQIDSLLNGLAEQACDPKTAANVFFEKTIQVIEAIVAPQWIAMLANGPSDSVVLVHGSPNASRQLHGLRSELRSEISSRAWIEQLSGGQVVVSAIEQGNLAWGTLIVKLDRDSSSVQREIVDGIAEVVGEFIRSQEIHDRNRDDSYVNQVMRFSLNAHSSLEPTHVAHQLANDARVLLGCERVSLFAVTGRKPRLLAISSVAKIEGRSALIKNLNELVARAIRTRESIFSDQPASDTRQNSLLAAHCERTELPFVFGVPLHQSLPLEAAEPSRSRQPIGFIVAESTAGIDRFKFARGFSYVAPHAELAMSNARTYHAIPFRRFLGGAGNWLNLASLSRFAVVIGLIAGGLFASLLFETDFKIRIRGELRPVIEQNVFAPRDAIVESVFVDHGTNVRELQPLVQLRSPELDLEIEKTDGEILRLEQLKDSKQIAGNQISNNSPDPVLAAQIASEISDLDFQIASMVEKAKFLRQQHVELTVLSPISGQITTWQPNQSLSSKPLRWGDPIVNVARLDGQWNAIFRVPERRIGYVLDQQQFLGEGHPVELEFFLESEPGTRFRVPVIEIAQSAGEDPELGSVTLLKCNVPAELLAKRQGASVAADVFCGRKSYWFVGTREMIDALKRRFVW